MLKTVYFMILLIAFSGLFFPSVSFAHWDVPGKEPYRTTVFLDSIRYFDDDWEDSFSGADLVIGWRVDLDGHSVASITDTIARDDLSLDPGSSLPIKQVIFNHVECSPLGDLRTSFWTAESDQENTLDTNRIMEEVIREHDISTEPLESRPQFEDAGDEWIGYSYHISRGNQADDLHYQAEVHVPLDAQSSLEAWMIIERNPIEDTGQCNQTEEKTALALPDWIKNNARWWAAGQISDKEFATGIEFMIKNNIISGYQVSSTALTGVSDEVKIPTWIKNNARWWSQNEISDQDFVKGIDFMIEEKILDLGPNVIKNTQNTISITLNKDIIKKIYETQLLNENSAKLLLQIKSFEVDYLEQRTDELWSEFNQNQNQTTMQQARDTEILLAQKQGQLATAVQIYNHAKQTSADIKDTVIQQVEPNEIESISENNYYDNNPIMTLSEYDAALREIEKISDMATDMAKQVVTLILQQLEETEFRTDSTHPDFVWSPTYNPTGSDYGENN
ncbi:MAG: hypothetical protein R3327_08385, partial [Nitrosopumilaceae archaeon]|nr:hypothetical protein [Nitrosopumilaceae archaeon]